MKEETKQIAETLHLLPNQTLCITPNKSVGYYGISKRSNEMNYTHELQIYFTQKPSWFHRMMNKLLIGWEWFDEKN